MYIVSKKKKWCDNNNLQLNLIKPKYVIYTLFKNDYQLGNNNDSKKIDLVGTWGIKSKNISKSKFYIWVKEKTEIFTQIQFLLNIYVIVFIYKNLKIY